MPEKTRDTMAAEQGLRSVESLYDAGQSELAKFALELIAPAIKALADPRQTARLKSIEAAIAGHLEPEPEPEDPQPAPTRRM